jgi:YVTN family beta-propeller protein
MARLTERRAASITATMAICASLLMAVAGAGAAQAAAATVSAKTVAAVTAPVAPPGSNLLLNPGAGAGDTSKLGWDAVTIPGWQVSQGLPTVVSYGTRRFPGASGAQPPGHPARLFAGGAGGTAVLTQQVPLRTAAGHGMLAGTRYHVSAWLGGTVVSKASLEVIFLSAAGRALGERRIGPVGGAGDASHPEFAWRQGSGTLPRGTRSARAVLDLETSLTNDNGPYAPQVGYDRATAGGLRFSVSAPARAGVLTPPAARVPRYQHVFMFYFENEDFRQIVGNTRQAPYLNSLIPRASLLGQFYAEEHPSDGNYLALAGGSTFGIPLDDPAEENPLYTIGARNISDLIDGARETWKTYLQSAAGPCDNTVHGYYWDDDQPMMYFADVRERPAYCAAHVVPLASLATDLHKTSTTPNFAWVSPDDCSDMEGCGIKAGDDFLKAELSLIMRSPAWTRQRSLAIVTFDEDAQDYQHPAQRVATIVLGSRGVRQGYVSPVRYTHYSLLRTVEGALGLGTLTANDLFAQPINDIFSRNATPRATVASAGTTATAPAPASAPALGAAARPAQPPAASTAAGPAQPPAVATASRLTRAAPAAAASSAPAPTAFVVNYASNSVTPVNLATRKAGGAIAVGTDPAAIAVTPNGRTAYVVNSGSGTVTPITTATRKAGKAIRVGADPAAIAITPNGRTAYVTNSGSDTVTPISTSTNKPGPAIPVGAYPKALAITPDGATVYVLDWEGGSVTPIATASNRAGPAIRTGAFPSAIAITPGGATAYVVNYGSDTVTPVSTATGEARPPIPVGQAPNSIAITPDGQTAYVVDGDTDAVTPISTATGEAGQAIRAGYSPVSVAVSPSGAAYAVNVISGTVTPVSAGSGTAGAALSVGLYDYPTAMSFERSGATALVVDTYAGQVTPVNTATGHVYPAITVGGFPVAAAITS